MYLFLSDCKTLTNLKGDMGHRRLFNTSQMFEMDHDQNPNPNPNPVHPEHSYVHLGMDRAGDNGSSMFPIENMPPEGINFAPHRNSVWRSNDHSSSNVSTEFPHWNSGRRSNDYTSSSIAMELPYYQPTRSGPTSDPVLHPPTSGSSSSVPPIYVDHPSSSHYRPEIHGVAGGIVNPTMGNGRGPSKRKRPAVPSDFERGSTSRYYNAGSIPNSSDLHSEKPQHWPRDPMSMTPRYRGSSLSIAGEGSQRNVRSRSTLDLNLPRTYAPEFPPHHLHSTGRPIEHSGTVDLAGVGVSVSASTHEWNHIPVSPASRGRPLASDASSSSRGVNQFPVASFSSDVSLDIGSFHHGLNSSRYPVVPPQSFHGSAMQPGRGGRSSHLQRVLPANGATASYPRTGFFTNSDHGPHMIPEVHPRHLRPVSMIGWHRSDRSGSSVSPYERLRSPSDEADLRDRYVTEGFSMLERSGVYSSRGFLDRHRDMRLDVDNMSYEELLDLGERIGTVNTGVCEDSISKCLMETIYCSLDETQEQSNCVICLEEYKNKEVVGTLTNCGHEYHEGCIKKWLSMKNVCPICKAPVLKEK